MRTDWEDTRGSLAERLDQANDGCCGCSWPAAAGETIQELEQAARAVATSYARGQGRPVDSIDPLEALQRVIDRLDEHAKPPPSADERGRRS